eukprot:scaffold136028_cov127-Phaeocystis_antarctica.AAC.1
MVVAMERPAPPRVPCDAQMLTRDLRRLGCGCGRCLVTGSRVICETTQIGCPWSRPRSRPLSTSHLHTYQNSRARSVRARAETNHARPQDRFLKLGPLNARRFYPTSRDSLVY